MCQSASDVESVDILVASLGLDPGTVWIMPEGIDAETITATLADLADIVVAKGYNLTTRMHVLAWGNKRGV